MTADLAEFQAKFRVHELAIAHTQSWIWSVRPMQSTLGAGVLSVSRFASSLAEVTPVEAAELATIVPTIENWLRSFSKPDKLNHLMLMMVDAHVHFHVIPRYTTARTQMGREWLDGGWPGTPSLADHRNCSPGVLTEIRDSLRRAAGSRVAQGVSTLHV